MIFVSAWPAPKNLKDATSKMFPDSLRVTLLHVWQALAPLNIQSALLGGVAVAIWSRIRATQDIDLIVSVPIRRTDEVIGALRRARLQPKYDPPRVVDLPGVGLVQFDYQLPNSYVQVRVDVQFAKGDFQQQVLERRVAVQVPGTDVQIDVVGCDDLILLKLLAGRVIDLADAADVLRQNPHLVNVDHLQTWARRLKVERDLRTIWDEAFPGFTPPHLPPVNEGDSVSP
jgi:hypothetical protein